MPKRLRLIGVSDELAPVIEILTNNGYDATLSGAHREEGEAVICYELVPRKKGCEKKDEKGKDGISR